MGGGKVEEANSSNLNTYESGPATRDVSHKNMRLDLVLSFLIHARDALHSKRQIFCPSLRYESSRISGLFSRMALSVVFAEPAQGGRDKEQDTVTAC